MKAIKYAILLSILAFSQCGWTTEFTTEQEIRIKELVRQTLVNDPSVLEQAISSLQSYQREQQTLRLDEVIKQNSQKLYNDPNSPRMGAEKPLVTLVVFTDYNCPYCKQFDPILEKVIKENPETALVIKYLPYKGPTSVKSAAEAIAVWQQAPEKFWAFNDLLFKMKGLHTDGTIIQAKNKAGVSDIQSSNKQIEELKSDFALANALNIEGTPSTLVGNQFVSGAVSYAELDAIVKQQIKLAK